MWFFFNCFLFFPILCLHVFKSVNVISVIFHLGVLFQTDLSIIKENKCMHGFIRCVRVSVRVYKMLQVWDVLEWVLHINESALEYTIRPPLFTTNTLNVLILVATTILEIKLRTILICDNLFALIIQSPEIQLVWSNDLKRHSQQVSNSLPDSNNYSP